MKNASKTYKLCFDLQFGDLGGSPAEKQALREALDGENDGEFQVPLFTSRIDLTKASSKTDTGGLRANPHALCIRILYQKVPHLGNLIQTAQICKQVCVSPFTWHACF